jgi:hypothetical protein
VGCAHPFWSSHEEKQPWLELSMGGGHGGSSERKGGGEARLLGALGWAWGGAATGGGDSVPAAPCGCSLFGPCACMGKKAGNRR